MNYILFDDSSWKNMLPITHTRPIADIRVGILTIKERWEKILKIKTSILTQDYLSKKHTKTIAEDNIFINASIFPHKHFIEALKEIKIGEAITSDGKTIAIRLGENDAHNYQYTNPITNSIELENIKKLNYSWDIFTQNEDYIKFDFDILTKGRKSAAVNSSNNILGEENIFIEEGASIELATINALNSKIYIGKDVTIGEGSILKGSLALCNNVVISMGTRLTGSTTLGPYCKFGGEINNTVVQGYSNKAHDGFIGNAVIGEWCNLGAGTNCSNLKNDYTPVKVWNYSSRRFMKTNLQFCGPIIGDHSKCAINSMLNTGTTLGVGVSIVKVGFPRNFVPSYSQGGLSGFVTVNFKTFLDIATRVMARRALKLHEEDIKILEHVYNISDDYKNY